MTTKTILPLERLNNRMVTFLENLPEPSHRIAGCPVWHIRVEINGSEFLLQTYGREKLMQTLEDAAPLSGKRAMIQLPKQQGAEWGARVFA